MICCDVGSVTFATVKRKLCYQRTGEASQAHKIEQLAHLTKLLQMQQQMDAKMEKMLTLGNLCQRRIKTYKVYASSCKIRYYNPYVG